MLSIDHSLMAAKHLQAQILCPMMPVAAIPVQKVEHAFLIQMVFSACVQLGL